MTFLKKYIAILFIFMLLIGGVAAGFSWVTDPYNIFKSNILLIKPTITRNARIAKAYQVAEYGADTIILGSSRAEAGLNPEKLEGKSYNLGLPQANISELLLYLKHAHHAHPIQKLIFQPDFFSFNVYQIDQKKGLREDILFIDQFSGAEKLIWQFKKYALLLNIDHIRDGWSTLIHRDKQKINGNIYFENGFNDPAHRLHLVLIAEGHQNIIKKSLIRYYSETWFPNGKDSFSFEKNGVYSFSFYEDILKFAKEEGIETKIILAPVHAWHLQALDAAGLWPLWIQWKERLVEINDRVGKFPLLDYSGYTPYTVEKVPQKKDIYMNWYDDSAHYRSDLGDLILSNSAHGAPLVTKRMPIYQARENLAHQAYKKQNPTDVYYIQKLAKEHVPKD